MTTAAEQHRKPLGLFADKPLPRLYDRIVEVLRVRHYSRRTEEVLTVDEVSRVMAHLTGDKWLIAMLLADGYDIRTVQELLGHSDVRTTMISTHVLNRGGRGVRSPADVLARRTIE